MRGITLFFLLLGSCTWVTEQDVECQSLLVDDDGDGYPLHEIEQSHEGAADWCDHLVEVDCDDTDTEIHPEAEDTWYDGVDADCVDDDDFDSDGDGYVPDEYEGEATTGVESTGELPGGDCDDANVEVHPGTEDTWYDGVDTDCNGQDDHDQDQDGYVPDEYEGLATTYVDGSGELPGGDCDDNTSGINPSATESWYDGVDTNCDALDDYDQDQDGYVPDEYEGLATAYVDGSGELPGGDCDDTSATVYPGAEDTWHDGVDSDCAGDDDYDQDLDGYVPDEYEGLATTYVDGSGELPGGDCDDTDPDAWPGATELLGDGIDQDCASDGDGFAFEALADTTWTDIRSAQLESFGSTVYLGISALYMETIDGEFYDSAVALSFDPDDDPLACEDVLAWAPWYSDPDDYELLDSMDMMIQDDGEDGVLYGVVGYATGDERQFSIRSYTLDASSTSRHNATTGAGSSTVGFDDLHLAVDEYDSLHAVGCSDDADTGASGYAWVTGDDLDANTETCVETLDLVSPLCAVDFMDSGTLGVVFTREEDETSAGLAWRTFEACDPVEADTCCPTVSDPAFEEGYDPLSLDVLAWDTGSRLLVFADEGTDTTNGLEALVAELDGDAVTFASLVSESGLSEPVYVDAALSPDADEIYLAYVGSDGTLNLAWGRTLSGFPLEHLTLATGIDPERCEVMVTEDGTGLYVAAFGPDITGAWSELVMGYAALE